MTDSSLVSNLPPLGGDLEIQAYQPGALYSASSNSVIVQTRDVSVVTTARFPWCEHNMFEALVNGHPDFLEKKFPSLAIVGLQIFAGDVIPTDQETVQDWITRLEATHPDFRYAAKIANMPYLAGRKFKKYKISL